MHPASRKVPTFVLNLNQNNTGTDNCSLTEQIHMEGKTNQLGARCVTPPAAYNNNLLHSVFKDSHDHC